MAHEQTVELVKTICNNAIEVLEAMTKQQSEFQRSCRESLDNPSDRDQQFSVWDGNPNYIISCMSRADQLRLIHNLKNSFAIITARTAMGHYVSGHLDDI